MSLNIDQSKAHQPIVEPMFVITMSQKKELLRYLETNTGEGAIKIWSDLTFLPAFPQKTIDAMIAEKDKLKEQVEELNKQLHNYREDNIDTHRRLDAALEQLNTKGSTDGN